MAGKLFHRAFKDTDEWKVPSDQPSNPSLFNSFTGICELTFFDYLKGTTIYNKNTSLQAINVLFKKITKRKKILTGCKIM